MLDTSVLVRYLSGAPAALADVAAEMIEGAETLTVTNVVLAETAFVLSSVYRVERTSIVDQLVKLIKRDNVETFAVDKGLVLQALLMCRPSRRVSFADALLWTEVISTEHRTVYTFDERFPSDGITLLSEPPSS